MTSRAQIERLRTRIEALAPRDPAPCNGALHQLREQIEGIATNLRMAAMANGDPWPPPVPPDELRRLSEHLPMHVR